MDSFNITTVVESMVKKNRNHFPIAVFLTTLICSHQMIVNLFFWVYDCNFEIMGACNTAGDSWHSSKIIHPRYRG